MILQATQVKRYGPVVFWIGHSPFLKHRYKMSSGPGPNFINLRFRFQIQNQIQEPIKSINVERLSPTSFLELEPIPTMANFRCRKCGFVTCTVRYTNKFRATLNVLCVWVRKCPIKTITDSFCESATVISFSQKNPQTLKQSRNDRGSTQQQEYLSEERK